MSDEQHPRIRQRSCVLTDVGVIRDHNEDAALADPEGDFFIVADGMGGHAAGEVASNMAVEAVRQALEESREDVARFARAPSDEGRRTLVSVLENAVRAAHQAVYERGTKESDKQGMGTTLDVVLVAGSEAFVAHVGDSRTYLLRDGRAAQITTDHTVAEVLVIEGKLSVEEAQISPLRTILVNAIGVAPDVGVEMAHVRLRKGDRVLLCSDGLHDYFPHEQEVSEHLGKENLEDALAEMVNLAKTRGGHDNITGVALEVLDTSETGESADDEPAQAAFEDTGSMPAVPVRDAGATEGAPAGEAEADGDDGDGDSPAAGAGAASDRDADDPDAVPEEIARDDTMPVEERPSSAGLDESGDKAKAKASKENGADADDKKPAAESGAGAGDKKAAGASDDLASDTDTKSTQRLKPLGGPGRKRRSRKSDRPGKGNDDEARADTEERPAEAGEEGASAPGSRSE